MIVMDLNFIVIIILIVYFFASVFLKISSKISVGISLILIGVAGLILVFGDDDLANKVAIIVFYLLIVAVALVIAESYRDLKKKEKVEKRK